MTNTATNIANKLVVQYCTSSCMCFNISLQVSAARRIGSLLKCCQCINNAFFSSSVYYLLL